MKKIVITAALMVAMIAANAQAKRNYWVVETIAPGTSIVKIYDLNNQLVSEKNAGRRIDITKKKERKMLNKMLVHVGKRYDSMG
ncbi:MAG: hypothetical protein WDO15_28500 [Bacteroidota bacterium]